jgi:putative addiction module component (TIGR02574 family)
MDFSEIVRLSVKQRIVLVDAIWESITADRRKTPLNEEDIEAMQKRIDAAEKKPSYMGQWEKMKKLQVRKK